MKTSKLKQEIKNKIEFAEKTIADGEDESGTFESDGEAEGYITALNWVLREIEKAENEK